MIEFIRIKNVALIEDLEIEFSDGLNVITGETGAGKSFILKSLDFLLGGKMTASMVRDASGKASVEAIFLQDGEECIIRREISGQTGRSRLFINDGLSSQATVKELRSQLVWHTSQHGQQKLLSPAYQAKLLDAFLPDFGLVAQRDAAVESIKAVLAEKQEVADRVRELSDKRDYMEFQSREIDKVDPQPGEEDELLARKQAHKNAAQRMESVKGALSAIHGMGEGLLEQLGSLSSELEALAAIDANYSGDAEAIEEMRQNVLDLDMRLRREENDAGGYDTEGVEARLFELAQLKRKLNRSLDEVLDFKNEIEENLSFLDSSTLDLKRLERKEEECAQALGEVLDRLNAARAKAGRKLAVNLENDLKGLGFSKDVKVSFEFTPNEIYPGLSEDRARLMWVPNPGQAPQPLDKIASGGELSRFLLAFVGLITRENLPTLIFDEVDAGIGGLTLNAVGDRMEMLSSKQQVILITHWPQLAALSSRHFQVSKAVDNGATAVSCRTLDQNEIFAELSRMAGGGEEGDTFARRLLDARN